MQKLLVQACCGPCACDTSMFEGYSTIYFFNGDNMNTRSEYDSRLFALRRVAQGLIVDMYNGPIEFAVCEDCIRYRLRAAARAAKKHGFDCFTTTLTVSPHKNTAMVNRIGREVAAEVGMPFLELNLKSNDGFARTVKISKELGLYRQNYCGCAKSVRQ